MRDGLSLQSSTTTCPFTLLSCANTVPLLLLLLLLPGGTSLLTQMRERLELDISAAAPGGTKVKVTAPVNPTERRHAVWIGELTVWHLRLWFEV
jgi:actin-related protein